MRAILVDIRLGDHRPLSDQIQEHVRDLIASGQLIPGEQLPATRALARMWHTSMPAVQTAMTALAKEGLLDRRHGQGTFVRHRDQRLEKVIIFYPGTIFGEQADAFQHALHRELQQLLAQRDIQADVWVDSRSARDQATAWRPLVRAIQERRVQGLIVPTAGPPHLGWLQKLAIPSAIVTPEDLPNMIGFDYRQLFDLVLGRLVEQGCRSVGLITPHPTDSTPRNGGVHPYVTYYDQFLATAQRLGLSVRDAWIRAPHGLQGGLTGRDMPSYGRREFHELWGKDDRPDGLLIEPDLVAQGVVMAVAERQVRVPNDLKLVLHKNATIDYLCPFPVTYVVTSEREVAEALLAQVEHQFRGEDGTASTVGYRLATADATHQTAATEEKHDDDE